MDVNLDGNTITNGYFSGIGEDLAQLNADNITTGTLPDARLSTDVALTTTANAFTQPQSILALSNLVANGFVKTTGGDGALSVDTSTYITGPITLSGDATGSGTTSIPVTVEAINGTSLASLASGLLYNTTVTGVPSIATPNQLAANLTGTTGTLDLSDATLKIPQGTAASLASTTLASGEPYWTTDTKELFLGDGTTLGGNAVVKVNSKNIYVSQSTGTDTRASGLSKYDPNIPYKTITAALAVYSTGDTIEGVDGTFTDKNLAAPSGVTAVNILLQPGAQWSVTGAGNGDYIFGGSGVTWNVIGAGQTISIATSTSSVSTDGSNNCNLALNNCSLSVSNSGGGSSFGFKAASNSLVIIGGNITSSSYAIQLNSGSNTYFVSGAAISTAGAAIGALGGVGTGTVGSLSDASASVGGAVSIGTGLTILNPVPIIQTLATPSTGFTQAFSYGPQDQNLVITPSATLATGTVTFPVDANTRINQKLWITNASSHTITSLAMTVSGGTIYGYTAGPLAPGSIMFMKSAANTWELVGAAPLLGLNNTWTGTNTFSANTVQNGTHNTAPNQTGITPGANDLINQSQAALQFQNLTGSNNISRGTGLTPSIYDSLGKSFAVKLSSDTGTFAANNAYGNQNMGYYHAKFISMSYYDQVINPSFVIDTVNFPWAYSSGKYEYFGVVDVMSGQGTMGVSVNQAATSQISTNWCPMLWVNNTYGATPNFAVVVTSAIICNAGDTITFSQTSSGTDGSQFRVVADAAVSSSTVIPVRSIGANWTAVPTSSNSAYLKINSGTPTSNAYVKNSSSNSASWPLTMIFMAFPSGTTGSTFTLNWWGNNQRYNLFNINIW